MKQLSKEFIGKGEVKEHRFVQLVDNGYGFIYEVFLPESNVTHFEVFERKENTVFDCISYPGSKSFGLWAWSTPLASRAKEILAEITKRKKEREAALTLLSIC